jgi:hypothetical protein
MKVYLVYVNEQYEGLYEDSLGLFYKREDAEAHVESMKKVYGESRYTEYEIREMEIK